MRTSIRRPVLFCALATLSFAVLAAGNEIVVLKGGKSMELSKPYVVKGSQAIMTLKDGTVISVPAGDVDKAATAAARAKAAASSQGSGTGAPAAVTPAEAAKAQQSAPKARVKLGDDDVSHGGYDESTGEATSEGEGSIQVVDWNQTVNGDAVVVKGTLRNTGKAVANNLALSINGRDDAGKTVATAGADIAAGSLEPGASAGFTASLNSSVRLASFRFAPTWTSPAPPKKEGQEASAATKKPAAPAAPKPAAEAAPKQPAYTPNPSYAAPTPSAPTTSPTDTHTGYIPGAHEEQPPPPPPR